MGSKLTTIFRTRSGTSFGGGLDGWTQAEPPRGR